MSVETGSPRIAPDDFACRFSLRASNLMWFLGAGTSASAGLPTAMDLVWEFKQKLFVSQRRGSLQAVSDLSQPNVRERLQAHMDSLGLSPSGAPDEYAALFEAVYPAESDRRKFLDAKLAGAKPSYGHMALAVLMRERLTRLVWTTNFDALVADAAPGPSALPVHPVLDVVATRVSVAGTREAPQRRPIPRRASRVGFPEGSNGRGGTTGVRTRIQSGRKVARRSSSPPPGTSGEPPHSAEAPDKPEIASSGASNGSPDSATAGIAGEHGRLDLFSLRIFRHFVAGSGPCARGCRGPGARSQPGPRRIPAPANPAPFVARGERCGGGDSVPGLTDPQARTPCRELYVLAPGRTTCCVAELTPILLSTIPLARSAWNSAATKPVVYVDAMNGIVGGDDLYLLRQSRSPGTFPWLQIP